MNDNNEICCHQSERQFFVNHPLFQVFCLSKGLEESALYSRADPSSEKILLLHDQSFRALLC